MPYIKGAYSCGRSSLHGMGGEMLLGFMSQRCGVGSQNLSNTGAISDTCSEMSRAERNLLTCLRALESWAFPNTSQIVML